VTLLAFLSALSFTVLITSLFALKFRYWRQPKLLIGYGLLFFTAEALAHTYVVPDAAFGVWLPILCFALSVPVIIAIYLLDRHERKHDRTEG
jgi:hypothetical protein